MAEEGLRFRSDEFSPAFFPLARNPSKPIIKCASAAAAIIFERKVSVAKFRKALINSSLAEEKAGNFKVFFARRRSRNDWTA